jgi:hypothetical protein
MIPVFSDLIMKMWPCGLTGASNASDYFTFTHSHATFHSNFPQPFSSVAFFTTPSPVAKTEVPVGAATSIPL